MSEKSKMRSCVVLLAAQFLAASTAVLADVAPPASVVVMRGDDSFQWLPPAKDVTDATVIVLRPESGSFLRETARLAAAAQDCEARLAIQQERLAHQQMAGAVQALGAIAAASWSASHFRTAWPLFVTGGSDRPAPPLPRRAPF